MQLVPQVFLTGSYPHSLGLLFLQPATSSYQNHAASQDSVTGRSINLARPTRSNRAVKIGLFLAGNCTTPLGATVSAARNFQLSKPRCVQDSVTGMSINLARPTRSNRAVKIGLFLAGNYPHPLGLLFLQLTTSSYQNHAALRSNTTKADSSASQRLPHGAEITEIGGQWNIISSIFVMGLWAIMGSATALYALKRVSPYPPSSRSRG